MALGKIHCFYKFSFPITRVQNLPNGIAGKIKEDNRFKVSLKTYEKLSMFVIFSNFRLSQIQLFSSSRPSNAVKEVVKTVRCKERYSGMSMGYVCSWAVERWRSRPPLSFPFYSIWDFSPWERAICLHSRSSSLVRLVWKDPQQTHSENCFLSDSQFSQLDNQEQAPQRNKWIVILAARCTEVGRWYGKMITLMK